MAEEKRGRGRPRLSEKVKAAREAEKRKKKGGKRSKT